MYGGTVSAEREMMTCQPVVIFYQHMSTERIRRFICMGNVATYPFSPVEAIHGDFYGKDILSLDQFAVEDLYKVFNLALHMKQLVLNSEPSYILAGKLITLLFFEPSSRTFGSFASAVK